MKAKHTLGPWTKAERLNGPWWHISSEYSIGGEKCLSGRQAVACVHGESKKGSAAYAEMFEANARLIAAAPELLGALQDLVSMYVDFINSGDAGNWNPEEEPEIIAARAAIAKATAA